MNFNERKWPYEYVYISNIFRILLNMNTLLNESTDPHTALRLEVCQSVVVVLYVK